MSVGRLKNTLLGMVFVIGWLGMFVLRIVYWAMAALLFIGIFVGVWHELKPFPAMALINVRILEYPFVISNYVINYAAANWFPLAIGMVFWCAVTGKMMLGRARVNNSSSLGSLVALLNYFEIQIETDAMKEQRAVGTWQLMKNGFKESLLSRLFWVPQPRDELTTKPVRNRAPASFGEDIDRKLKGA